MDGFKTFLDNDDGNIIGIGNAFDSIVSLVAYAFLLKKEKINILKVE